MNSSGGGIDIYGNAHTAVPSDCCTGVPWGSQDQVQCRLFAGLPVILCDDAGVVVRLPTLLVIVRSRAWKMGDSGKPSEWPSQQQLRTQIVHTWSAERPSLRVFQPLSFLFKSFLRTWQGWKSDLFLCLGFCTSPCRCNVLLCTFWFV